MPLRLIGNEIYPESYNNVKIKKIMIMMIIMTIMVMILMMMMMIIMRCLFPSSKLQCVLFQNFAELHIFFICFSLFNLKYCLRISTNSLVLPTISCHCDLRVRKCSFNTKHKTFHLLFQGHFFTDGDKNSSRYLINS